MPRQSIRGDISRYSPQPERLCHWSQKEWAYCSGPGPGFVECVAFLWDLRIHSHSSILNQLAGSRLYEIQIGCLSLWVVSSGNVSQQPRNGLFPSFIYILSSAVLFSCHLFAQEVLKESQTKQEVICFLYKGYQKE